MSLEFDEEKHRYTLEGKDIPFVSGILEPLVDFSMVPEYVLECKRQFGTNVHKAVKYYLQSDLDESSLSDELVGCLDAFRKWERTEKWDLSKALIETPQFHTKLKYAGTPDIDHEYGVIDLKTREPNTLTDPLQLSAYKNFGDPKRPGYILYLDPDGSYIFKKMIEGQSWQIFRKLLKRYKDNLEFENFIEKLKNQK